MSDFKGFPRPDGKFTMIPNIFFDERVPLMTDRELRVVLYIARHTWGFNQGFGQAVKLTQDEIMNGRKRKDGSRMDKGTGLSRNTVKAAIEDGIKNNHLLLETDDSDVARQKRRYSIVIESSEPDTPIDDNKPSSSDNFENENHQNLTVLDKKSSKVDPRTDKEKNNKTKKTRKKSKPAVGGTDAKADKAKADAKINAMAAVMIKSWISETGAVKPDAQALYNKTAVGLVNNGVTVANVIDYIRHLKTQDFWRGKTPSFDYIATNIKGWLDDKAKPTNDPKRFGEQHTTDTADYSQDELIETGKAQVRLLYDPSKGSFIEHLNKIIVQDNHLSEPARLLLEDEKQHG